MTEHEHRLDLVGQTLMGKLQVLRLLGEGGMGAVYEVEHLITRHRRALKVMHQRFAASTETVARFIREAGVAGTLKTPHVVETYDAGQLDDGSPYVLMELLQGTTFADLLDSFAPGGPDAASGRLSPGRVVGIVCQVLEGLAVAHDAGIVHRDIKPDNVFVSHDERGRERVRILDFGISKFAATDRNSFSGVGFDGTLTSDHTVMGTPYYMSPEQATGAKLVDERSDIYSIGVMLYEGIAGVRPFDAQNMAQLVIKIHAGEYQPLGEIAPHASPELVEIVERAMHRDAAIRFTSARELLAALLPHAESNYTSSLQTLRNSPSGGPPAVMPRPVPRKIDGAAPTLAAPPERATPRWLAPTAVVALALIAIASVAIAMRGVEAPERPAPTPAPVSPAVPPVVAVPEPPPAAAVPETPPVAVPEPSPPPTPVITGRRRVPRHPEATAEAPVDEDIAPGGTAPGPRRRIVRDVY